MNFPKTMSSWRKMFNFKLKTHLVFGAATSEQLGKILTELGYRKVGIILDRGIVAHPQTRKALESIKAAQVAYQTFENDAIEPDYDFLEAFKKPFLNQGFECLVGIGGGSTLDLTKGVATLVTNPGEAISYRGFPKLQHRPLPVVAIPTTAGTGSEVTYNAVFTDAKQKKKLGINSEYNYPVQAILDPLFTVGCPKAVTVSSGADALVHTLESYVHKNHTPVSRMYSTEAFRLLYNNLNKVLDHPQDIEIRGHLALGAYLAGAALINAGSGPSGAFSYPLGAVYKVPHGYAGAIFLPEITRLNVEKGYQDYAALYDLMEGADKKLAVKEKNSEFVKRIAELMTKLDVPKAIAAYKLTDKDAEFLIEQYDVLKAAIDQNPMEITKEDVRKMMTKIFHPGGTYARV